MTDINKETEHRVIRAWGQDKVGLLQRLSKLAAANDVEMLAGIAHTFGDQAVIFMELAASSDQFDAFSKALSDGFDPDELHTSLHPVAESLVPDQPALPWRIQVTAVNVAGMLEYISAFIAQKGLTIISWHGEPYTPPRAVRLDACVLTFTVLLPRDENHLRLHDELEQLKAKNPAVLITAMMPL